MEKQSIVPVVDGCTECQHVAEHLRSIGIEVATRPVEAPSAASLEGGPEHGDLWSGFRPGVVTELEGVR